jgi:hypothetical protein
MRTLIGMNLRSDPRVVLKYRRSKQGPNALVPGRLTPLESLTDDHAPVDHR